MHVIYIITTCVAAAMNGYAAVLNFAGTESVKTLADRVRVPRSWMIPLGTLLAGGASDFSRGSRCLLSGPPLAAVWSCTLSAR